MPFCRHAGPWRPPNCAPETESGTLLHACSVSWMDPVTEINDWRYENPQGDDACGTDDWRCGIHPVMMHAIQMTGDEASTR